MTDHAHDHAATPPTDDLAAAFQIEGWPVRGRLVRLGQTIDTIWFRKLKSSCGSVVHLGDNLTGEGDGDDEVITVDLTRLPSQVEYLAFTVNSFRGQTFNEVDNAFCRVVDQSRKELARYQLTEQGSHTGIIIASLSRNNGEWDFTAHGKASTGRTIDDMHADIVATVVR